MKKLLTIVGLFMLSMTSFAAPKSPLVAIVHSPDRLNPNLCFDVDVSLYADGTVIRKQCGHPAEFVTKLPKKSMQNFIEKIKTLPEVGPLVQTDPTGKQTCAPLNTIYYVIQTGKEVAVGGFEGCQEVNPQDPSWQPAVLSEMLESLSRLAEGNFFLNSPDKK